MRLLPKVASSLLYLSKARSISFPTDCQTTNRRISINVVPSQNASRKTSQKASRKTSHFDDKIGDSKKENGEDFDNEENENVEIIDMKEVHHLNGLLFG
jgi:hypothetical protein